MAQAVFHRGRQLRHCLPFSRHEKDRVVAETGGAHRVVGDCAFANASAGDDIAPGIGQRGDADETRSSFARGHEAQVVENQRQALVVGWRQPRRVDAGAAVEGIDFQPGIVRQGEFAGLARSMQGLFTAFSS